MAAELLPMLARAGDSDNNPLSGALWYFYATGTTTPRSVYTTSDLSVAHANPVVADSAGKFAPIYFDASLVYRGVLKDAAGATIFDVDPINSGVISTLTASTGAASVGFIASGASAVARTIQAKARDTVSVKDYGATGDGTTDDTAAIQAALDSGAEEVVFPPGTYITTGLTIGLSAAIKKLRGYGRPVIQLTAAASRIALDILKAQYVTIDGIDFRSGAEANIGTAMTDGFATVGVRTKIGGSYLYFRNMRVAGFSLAGFQLRQTVNVQFVNVDGHNCYRARLWQPDSGNPCAASRIRNGYVTGCTSGDYSENGLTDFDIDGVIYEYCGSASDEAAIRVKGGGGRIAAIYTEANGRNLWFTDCLLTHIKSGNENAATNADVKTYVGTAFADRGYSELKSRSLKVGEILPDATVDVSVTTGLHVGGSGAGQSINLNATRLLTTRKTGWAVDTGTAKRTANATYSGTAEAAYTQATIQALMDAVRDLSQTVKALKDDLHATAGHGLIGT